MDLPNTHIYSFYGEGCHGQMTSPTTPSSLRPSVGFSTVNAWQCLEDCDLVDSILLRGASFGAPPPHDSQAAARLLPHGATGSRDVLGANLLRGIRSTLAPIPFTSTREASAQPLSVESATLERFLIDSEKDLSTMNRIINLDSLCATFNSDREESTPLDSSPSISFATELQDQDLLERCCEVCGRKDGNQALCSGGCASTTTICNHCCRKDESAKAPTALLHRLETGWLCTLCRKSELHEKLKVSEPPATGKRRRSKKRTCQAEKDHQEDARACKQRCAKSD